MEYTADLVATNWIPLGVATAQSWSASFRDNAVNGVTTRFYRVLERP